MRERKPENLRSVLWPVAAVKWRSVSFLQRKKDAAPGRNSGSVQRLPGGNANADASVAWIFTRKVRLPVLLCSRKHLSVLSIQRTPQAFRHFFVVGARFESSAGEQECVHLGR
jgi:hypothetical protein